MNRRSLVPVFTAAAIIAIAALVSIAGPTDPPPGPVSPQYKTLSEVEPRGILRQSDVPITINAPGSYYLVENLFAPQLVTALITVNSPGVTIDLRGFELDGATDVGEATNCIRVNPAANGVRIANGTIRQSTQTGITCSGDGAAFRNLVVTACGGFGIMAMSNSVIESCIATGNATTGIGAGTRSVVRACTSAENSVGFTGSGTFESCTAQDNEDIGFAVSGAISTCVASDNGNHGFSVSGSISGCSSTGNGGAGFFVSSGVISDCSAGTNTVGITLFSESIAQRCSVRGNSSVGISLTLRCTALENTVTSHLNGTGIQVSAGLFSGNRIEGNTLTFNDTGISVGSAANIIIRNIAQGNETDYDIVAGNTVGAILDVAGAEITTSNPWRNLSY